MTPATRKIPSYAHSAFSLNDKVHNLIHEDNVNPFLPQNLNEKKKTLHCGLFYRKTVTEHNTCCITKVRGSMSRMRLYNNGTLRNLPNVHQILFHFKSLIVRSMIWMYSSSRYNNKWCLMLTIHHGCIGRTKLPFWLIDTLAPRVLRLTLKWLYKDNCSILFG